VIHGARRLCAAAAHGLGGHTGHCAAGGHIVQDHRASGDAGMTVSADGMTADPETVVGEWQRWKGRGWKLVAAARTSHEVTMFLEKAPFDLERATRDW